MKRKILITGSTDGIGKLAAMRLAKDGHHLFLHGRSEQKLAAVIADIKDRSPSSAVEGFLADFSNLSEVKNMSERIHSNIDSLDVLINNAGVFNSKNAFNVDGLDLRFVVNYIAPYLLTNALVPLLQKGDAARIINLSSAAQAPVSLTALEGKQQLSESEAYAQSKLALTMWSIYLSQQLKDVIVIPVNPGSLLNTNMVREAYGKFWSEAEKGGNILYDLAVSEDYADSNSQYFDNDKGDPKGDFSKAHRDAYDLELTMGLIERTESLIAVKL